MWKNGIIESIDVSYDPPAIRLTGGRILVGADQKFIAILKSGDFIGCSIAPTDDDGVFSVVGGRIFTSSAIEKKDTDVGWADDPDDAEIQKTLEIVEGQKIDVTRAPADASTPSTRFRPPFVDLPGIGEVPLYPTEQEASILAANIDLMETNQ